MEKLLKNSVNNGLARLSHVCLLFVLFILSSGNRLFAQTDSASTSNIKNNLAAAAKEIEKAKHEEFMSYVYMCVGFAIVIGIAWSTTVMARNRSKRQQVEKQRYILRQQELKKHHGHTAHGHGAHGHRR